MTPNHVTRKPRTGTGPREQRASARLTEIIEENGGFLIRSHGCPLAAATANHPEVCNALESLLSEFVGTSVSKCCDRYDRLRCCFEIGMSASPSEPVAH